MPAKRYWRGCLARRSQQSLKMKRGKNNKKEILPLKRLRGNTFIVIIL
jgi:hypothetical protein